MIPKHALVAAMALAALSSRSTASADVRKERDAVTTNAETDEPTIESRQVRRARQRREAKRNRS